MWFAIAITVLAAGANNVGKVLQKQATRTLPRLVLKREIILQYLRSGAWVAGMLTDLAGALLMIVAFAYAPVSVVQPVSAVGLVILFIFSHFYLKERLKPMEWVAAAVAFAGVMGLGLSAEPSHLDHPTFSAGRMLGSFVLLVLALVGECWWRHSLTAGGAPSPQYHHHMRFSGGPAAMPPHVTPAHAASDAVMCGLEAGACFGFSAAACRTGFILASKLSVLCVPLGLLGSMLLTTSGFVLQTRGLKTGNTVVVCTMAATSSMISGVIAGFVILDERLPTHHGMKVVRLSSWACILLGVTWLAGGPEAMPSLLRAVTQALPVPSWAWRLMPRPVARAMRRMQKRMQDDDDDEALLPVTNAVPSNMAVPATSAATAAAIADGPVQSPKM